MRETSIQIYASPSLLDCCKEKSLMIYRMRRGGGRALAL